MVYDIYLADRIRRVLQEKHVAYEEKKMMGGLCFMVAGKMCMGVVEDRLMARIDPAFYEEALTRKGCREMDFTGRPMRGFVFVGGEGIDGELDLTTWIQYCLDYNPMARSSRKNSQGGGATKPD